MGLMLSLKLEGVLGVINMFIGCVYYNITGKSFLVSGLGTLPVPLHNGQIIVLLLESFSESSLDVH